MGRRLGALLRPGDVIALAGDLGAGKTVFAHGLAAGARTTGYLASPTFTLIREYPGPLPIFHVDLYRLDDVRQLDDLGLDEILDGGGAVVIEWAEKAAGWLPSEHLWVEISFVDGDDRREITFTPRGARHQTLASQLEAEAPPPPETRPFDRAQGRGPRPDSRRRNPQAR